MLCNKEKTSIAIDVILMIILNLFLIICIPNQLFTYINKYLLNKLLIYV